MKRRSWTHQSAHRTGGGFHKDKREKRSQMSLLNIFREAEHHVIDNGLSPHELKIILNHLSLNVDNEQFSFDELLDGANHEIEHADVVDDSPSKTVRIAVDHLREDPHYYRKLKEMETRH